MPMDKPMGDLATKPKQVSTVWPRMAGSIAGLLIGGVCLGLAGWGLVTLVFWIPVMQETSLNQALTALWLSVVLSTLFGATFGAALGATLAQKLMKRRSSCWRTMLVAMVGMVVGVPLGTMVGIVAEVPLAEILIGMPVAAVFIAAGAVIGSGWKVKPTENTEIGR
jgi:hypothetical protein